MKQPLTIIRAIEEIKRGRPVIVVDSPSRENQADLFFPAELANKDNVNFMINHARGLICVPINGDIAERLDIRPMVEPGLNSEPTGVNFTVSVDADKLPSFGISAEDRAKTIRTIASPKSSPKDLLRPGHIFPLLARPGGVRERAGHTEAAVMLAEMAGFAPAGVICEILGDDGSPLTGKGLASFADKHDLKVIYIADLVAYAAGQSNQPSKTRTIVKVASSKLPTAYGEFEIRVYRSLADNKEHTALILGDYSQEEPVLTRVHSQCLTGDTFGSLRCDCQAQLNRSLNEISSKGRGVLIYLSQEGRGIGLGNKIKAYALQDKGRNTVEANLELGFTADARTYEAAAGILADLGIKKINLLTNNPEKVKQLKRFGLSVKRLPLEIAPNSYTDKYLLTKKKVFGHKLNGV